MGILIDNGVGNWGEFGGSYFIINGNIVQITGDQIYMEGCLGQPDNVVRCKRYLKQRCKYKTLIIYHLHWKELEKITAIVLGTLSWSSVNVWIINIIKLITRLKKKMLIRCKNPSQAVVPLVPSPPDPWSCPYLAISLVTHSCWLSSHFSLHLELLPSPSMYKNSLIVTIVNWSSFKYQLKCNLPYPQVELTPFL